MHIEVIVAEQIVKRYHLPDKYLEDIPGYTWQQNHEAREKIIQLHLADIKRKMQELFPKGLLRYQIALESKMNQENFVVVEEVKPLPKKVKKAV